MRLLSVLVISWYKTATALYGQGVCGLIIQTRHSGNGLFSSRMSGAYIGNGWGMKPSNGSFTHMSGTWSGQLEENPEDLAYICPLHMAWTAMVR